MAVDNRVGPYRILRLINRGGQGSVYLGYDKRLHRRVAIKIYRQPAKRAARKHLLREAQLVASIQSQKVVQIHDVIESSEHLAMVMEYVPGCDLEEFLASVRPSLATVLTIGADIAGALAVARQQHIVHGDLKAGNILIAASGRVKLTDFGIARSTQESSSRPLAGASQSAVSPEQYLGKPLDLRSDLFSLGCLLYRMLSGEQPFMRGGQLDARLLLEQSPRPLEELVASGLLVPEELLGLISDLLQKDPEDRPASTRRVRQVLRRVSRDIPLAASSSLLLEARPCFRAESADDIPPQVPADLGREGRSRLSLAGGSTLRHRLSGWSWPARCTAALVLVVAAGAPLVIAVQDRETFVHIDQPLLRLDGNIDLPREVSSRWLVEEVKLVLHEQLGALNITGPVGATRSKILYASGNGEKPPPEPQERLQITLRCAAGLCVFAISREHAARHFYKQGVLLPEMPVSQWRDIIHGATRGLYL